MGGEGRQRRRRSLSSPPSGQRCRLLLDCSDNSKQQLAQADAFTAIDEQPGVQPQGGGGSKGGGSSSEHCRLPLPLLPSFEQPETTLQV